MNFETRHVSLNREEQKFPLSLPEFPRVIETVRKNLPGHSLEPQGYGTGVRTIYFDTEDFHYYNFSRANPRENLKIRVKEYFALLDSQTDIEEADRRYPSVYLELKMRLDDYTRKIRIKLDKARLSTMERGSDFFNDLEKYPFSEDQQKTYRELAAYVSEHSRLKDLRPVGYVEYQRKAFQNPEDSLRVSFDQNIKYFQMQDRLLQLLNHPPMSPARIGGEDGVIMEVKNISPLPGWLQKEVKSLSKDSYSKFKTCCGMVLNHDRN